jgi:hypothetical protein
VDAKQKKGKKKDEHRFKWGNNSKLEFYKVKKV